MHGSRNRQVLRAVGILLANSLAIMGYNPRAFGQANDIWLGGNGNWSNGAMWSAGIPQSTFNVFIDGGNPAPSAVTLDVQTQCNNLTIDSDDSLSLNNATDLQINGSSVSNAGSISINSAGSFTEMLFASSTNAATLSGTGAVTLTGNLQSTVDGNGGLTLTNQSTIQGLGTIGVHLMLANQGTINANIAGGTLLVNLEQGGASTNTATMEATNGGTLELSTGGGQSINNTGGTILATGTGSQVSLTGFGTVITGGTLSTSSGGVIGVPAGTGYSPTLNGPITTAGTYQLGDGTATHLSGTITNNGTIQLNSAGSTTLLDAPNSSATLAGTGTVTLSNNNHNQIDGGGGLTLTSQNTVQGVGEIGPHVSFTNQGTVNANVAGATLFIDQENGGGVTTNTATMEATRGGILQLQSGGGQSIQNTGGTIKASGTGSEVLITGFGTLINGGTLTTSSGGIVAVTGTPTLSGVTNSGTYEIINAAVTHLSGTVTNNGTIQLNSAGSNTLLDAPFASATLAGKGKVILSNNTNNQIDGGINLTLTNKNTIQGVGLIGPHVVLANQGTVNANTSGTTLSIQQLTNGNDSNSGTMEATNGATLKIQSSNGSFNNTGTLVAASSSTVDITGGFANFAGSTLTGGKYTVTGTLEFDNANIVTNAAAITLTGGTAQILNNQNNANALAPFATNSGKGIFTLSGNQTFQTAGNFTNSGVMTISKGSTFTVGLSGSYVQNAGKTTVDGTLAFSTTASFPSGSLILAGTGSVRINKGLVFGNGGTIASTVRSSGAITPADSPTTTGTLAIAGAYIQNSTGVLDINIQGTTVGTGFNQLTAAGAASLNGTLNIGLLNGFVPAIGTTFQILTARSVTGVFATVNGAAINSNEHFTVTYNSNNVTLTVVAGQ